MVNRPTPEFPADLLTLTEAARLTGQPKAYLRELIDAGRLAIHLWTEDGTQRTRLSRQTLTVAGLLATSGVEARTNDLTKQLRKQSERLARLERQLVECQECLATTESRLSDLERRSPEFSATVQPVADVGRSDNRRLRATRKPLPVSRRPFR